MGYRAKSFAMKYCLKPDPREHFSEWQATCGEMRHLDDSMFARAVVEEIWAKHPSGYRFAGPDVQAQFSIETVRPTYADPAGMHKTWKYVAMGMDSTLISSLLVEPARRLGTL